MTPAASPSARGQHALAFDSVRGKTVLFGGNANGGTYFSDTWEWDGTTWTQMNPAASPSARGQHALAFDSVRGKTVLFGGMAASFGGPPHFSDTWEWNGTTWVQQTPAASPTGRIQGALVYDSARGRTVLFGGVSRTNGRLSDTWEWDGFTWTDLTPAPKPTGRYRHALAYDSARVDKSFGG
ncbi:MAG: hypothetical protein IPK72_20995 [Candidatus Eisenbacteria bacterium]|nr:hypothetical protein [Candidatus Eisenbacteria bacterium]